MPLRFNGNLHIKYTKQWRYSQRSYLFDIEISMAIDGVQVSSSFSPNMDQYTVA